VKIENVRIRNFRSIAELDLVVNDYTALVGANGAGKSSVLYALRWFYEGGALMPEDCHAPGALDPTATEGTVEVSVTFSDLTAADRARLESYGRGQTATFKRYWTVGEPKDKVIGNALQGPGFSEIRLMKKVGEFRPAYGALRAAVSGLPELEKSFSKDDVLHAFAAWESDVANVEQLEVIADEDASHMFGIGGTHVINQCSRFILVPAATDISSEVAGMRKGTALGQLIGAVMDNAATVARETWLRKHEDVLDELTASIRAGIHASTATQTTRVNSRLAALVPTASIDFKPEVPEWSPNPTASVVTTVSIDGYASDVARQGHGVQRAVLIAMLQALIPDEQLVRSQMGADASQADVEALVEGLPHIIVALEEPEIYQHPARARSFARVLTELSERVGVQVMVATHSPYFVLPRHYSSLKRFALDRGVTQIKQASFESVVKQMPNKSESVRKYLDKYVPSSFSEGFFADAVVLVEGETDKIILESVAELLGTPLDAAGVIVINCESKTGLKVPAAIFGELDVPVYVIFDGDANGHLRKGKPGAEASHEEATNLLLQWLPQTHALHGTVPTKFTDPTAVCVDWAAWEDDLEAELEQWPSFVAHVRTTHADVRAVGKNLSRYRNAVLSADPADLPAQLKVAIEAICSLGGSHLVL
jgi:putative ATP-dependent endonuclease of OLD family